MLGICNNLGLLPDQFFPQRQAGRDYTPSPYLELLKDHRDDFTVFSGVSHPDVDGGHPADNCFLTAAPHPGSGGFRNTISLDQYVAERIGHLTRFPSLTLGRQRATRAAEPLLDRVRGVLIPCEEKASEVFQRLFLQGTPAEVRGPGPAARRWARASWTPSPARPATSSASVGARDRDRLDQYFTGVRDLEQRLVAAPRVGDRGPSPSVDGEAARRPGRPARVHGEGPADVRHGAARLRDRLDPLRHAHARQRELAGHRGRRARRSPTATTTSRTTASRRRSSRSSRRSTAWHMKLLAELFGELKGFREGGETLLDRTMVLYGSNLGNANTHVTTNLPVLFAGGGFKHGQHLAFDRERNYPLPNLFVSMLQRLGIEADRSPPAPARCGGWSWPSDHRPPDGTEPPHGSVPIFRPRPTGSAIRDLRGPRGSDTIGGARTTSSGPRSPDPKSAIPSAASVGLAGLLHRPGLKAQDP